MIITVRLSPGVFQSSERLRAICEVIPHDLFDITIIDYGTEAMYRAPLDELEQAGHYVIRHPAPHPTFSIGQARDYGVQVARQPVVMFHDIDFHAPTEIYRGIHAEAERRGLDRMTKDFFCVPVLFLTERGTKTYHASAEKGRHLPVAPTLEAIRAADSLMQFPSYGSSAMVINRHHYLATGGHDRRFFGHGAEDFDLLHRLAALHPKGERPPNYYIDYKHKDIVPYRGFRPYFAKYGLDVLERGLYLVHRWHPVREAKDYRRRRKNFALLRKVMKEFDRKHAHLRPLPDLNDGTRLLLLCDERHPTFGALRQYLSLFGDYIAVAENRFKRPDALLAFVREQAVDAVLVPDPYANDARLALYRGLRENGITAIAFDRGALPGSWFFDAHGYKAASTSYAAEHWRTTPAETEDQQVDEIIRQLSERATKGDAGAALRRRLAPNGERILLIVLQDPAHGSVRHFAGPARDWNGFLASAGRIAEALQAEGWKTVARLQQADTAAPELAATTILPADTDGCQLIGLADAVLTLNADAGLVALALGKPVVALGDAFYCQQGLALPAPDAATAVDMLSSIQAPDERTVRQFLRHLAENVYSFGKGTYRTKKRLFRPAELQLAALDLDSIGTGPAQ